MFRTGMNDREIKREAVLLAAPDRAGSDRTPNGRADPFRAAGRAGAVVRFAELGSLKGLYTVINNRSFIVLNTGLGPVESAAVCAHELGHHVLHRDLARGVLFGDYALFLRNSRAEFEANCFACHLLIDDRDLCCLLRAPDCAAATVDDLAAKIGVLPQLLALKLNLCGFDVRSPDAGFWGK